VCIVKTGMIRLGRKDIVSDEIMSKNDFPVNSSTETQRDINKINHILANHGPAVYSVSNNFRGWRWLPRRRRLVVPHRGKTVDCVTVLIPKSYLVVLKRY
jgi:hypothetical protein